MVRSRGGPLYEIRGAARNFIIHQDRLKRCGGGALPRWAEKIRAELLGKLHPKPGNKAQRAKIVELGQRLGVL